MDETNKKSAVTRRQFLGIAWGVSLAGLFGQAGVALLQYLQPRPDASGFGSKIIAGRPQEFKKNTVHLVQKGHFFIAAQADGGYLAMWQRCTHLGCTVPYRADEKQFHCPCHGSVFNPQGEVIGGPAPRPLDIFPITLEDGNLVVDTGHPIERDKFDPSQVFHV